MTGPVVPCEANHGQPVRHPGVSPGLPTGTDGLRWHVVLRPLFPSRALSLFRGPRWLTLAALLTGCRSPTEVELVLSTDVPCASFKGAAIFVSSSQEGAESSAPSTIAYSCEDTGALGSLIVIPAGDKDQPLFVRIVAGIDLDATRCTTNDPDGQCIVTRRRLSFLPHEHLTLPISLDVDCRGRVCGQTEACQQGRCIDATVDPNSCTSDDDACTLPALSGQGGGGGQGGGQSGGQSGGGQSGGSGGQPGLSGSSGQGGGGGQAGISGSSGSAGQDGQAGLAGQGGLSGTSGQGGSAGASSGAAGTSGGSQSTAGQSGGGGMSSAGQGGQGGGKGLGGSSISSLGGASLCGADATPCGDFTVCDGTCCGDDYTCQSQAGHDLYRCVGTTWTQVGSQCDACPDAGGPCETNYCATEGATRCPPSTTNATQMQVCQGHQWATVDCASGFECYAQTDRCTCAMPSKGTVAKDGSRQCAIQIISDGPPETTFQTCQNGSWTTGQKCIGTCDPDDALGGNCSLGSL